MMNVSNLNVFDPKNINEVINLLNKEPGKWEMLAGGTDLLVQMDNNLLRNDHFINLWGLPELRGIEVTKDEIIIGALTTFSDILNDKTIQKEFPMMVEAANLTGSIAIQNRGTVGGNIMNGSPAADTPPALLAYSSEIILKSKSHERRLFYKDFHTGYKQMRINPDEILYKIILPRTNNKVIDFYKKVGTRAAHSISKSCIAIRVIMEKKTIRDIKIGLGSVAARPIRTLLTESVLRGQEITDELIDNATLAIAKEIHPIDDIRSNKEYRLRVAINLLRHFLRGLK